MVKKIVSSGSSKEKHGVNKRKPSNFGDDNS